MPNLFFTALVGLGLSLPVSAMAQTKEITINAAKPGAKISDTMYGIFFEDINFGADGGLYAELVKNRSFEFPQHLMGWKSFGNVKVLDDGPFKRNPHYVRLGQPAHKDMGTGLDNEGFFGIGLHKGAEYRFSVWARLPENSTKESLRVELIDPASQAETQVLVSKPLDITSGEWKKYQVVLKSPADFAKAHLRIFLTSKGQVDLEHVSLFPVDTWKGHENGMRKDLAQALYDLRPGVFRFPGGCIVEGTNMDDRYQWKNTVGPVEDRPLNRNRWEYTFHHRYFPDYFQSYGLGFYEYFQLSEEIGAEPLPILNVGLACQYQNPASKKDAQVPLDSLRPYIQDALDLIEFANGSTTTKWGKLRADMGHPAPFNLKYLGVGNEQWGPLYPERLALFVKELRKIHPEIQIIGSSGPNSEGKDFDYLWPQMKKLKVDLVDEHFYRPENWFINSAARYDNYDRKGPKVFAGEYACHGKGRKFNHFHASLLEAAFMTGLERNADVVRMATYAPLFAHVEGWQWRPDLIWYDNTRSVRSCSYYVQQLYSQNKGTNTLAVKSDGKNVTGQDGIYASAVWDAKGKQYIVKVVNITEKPQSVKLNFKGLKKSQTFTQGSVITYGTDKLYEDNTLDNPTKFVPTEKSLNVSGTTLTENIPAYTFAVYKVK